MQCVKFIYCILGAIHSELLMNVVGVISDYRRRLAYSPVRSIFFHTLQRLWGMGALSERRYGYGNHGDAHGLQVRWAGVRHGGHHRGGHDLLSLRDPTGGLSAAVVRARTPPRHDHGPGPALRLRLRPSGYQALGGHSGVRKRVTNATLICVFLNLNLCIFQHCFYFFLCVTCRRFVKTALFVTYFFVAISYSLFIAEATQQVSYS